MGHKPAGMPEEFAQAVNDEIKAEMARSKEHASNRKLAQALGVSGDYINRRIANVTAWDLHDLERLGELFGLHPEAFVNRAVGTMVERGVRAADELAQHRSRRTPSTPLARAARKRPTKSKMGDD